MIYGTKEKNRREPTKEKTAHPAEDKDVAYETDRSDHGAHGTIFAHVGRNLSVEDVQRRR